MASPRTLALRSTIKVLGYLGFTPYELTRRHARQLGVHVGDETRIYDDVDYGSEPWLVRIGRGSIVTAGVHFVTHDASVAIVRNGPFGVAAGERLNRMDAVIVGENCFVG